MKYAIVFLLAFTLLFTLFSLLFARAALIELKYFWLERKPQRNGRHARYGDIDY